MRKDEMEAMLQDLQLEKRVERRVRYHCIAFWSGVTTVVATLGAWSTSNSEALKAGFRAFLNVWMEK